MSRTDQFVLPQNGPMRNGKGQPLIVPEGGGERTAYQRTTEFVAAFKNTYGIERSYQGRIVRGLSECPELMLAASAAVVAGDDGALRKIGDEALAHTRPQRAADIGTWLHDITARLDMGQNIGQIPADFADDIAAYERTIKASGIEFTAIEQFRVHDGFRVAGTADRIGRINGALTVFDIKTGSIDFAHEIAMQLAMYARSRAYDVETDTRLPADLGLNLRWGIIIHLPQGQGRCTLHRVDILKGWAACQLAKQAWDWRRTQGLLEPLAPIDIKPSFIDQALTAADPEELRQLWRQAKRQCAVTSDFLAACGQRSKQLSYLEGAGIS
jgi:hypothetical protein